MVSAVSVMLSQPNGQNVLGKLPAFTVYNIYFKYNLTKFSYLVFHFLKLFFSFPLH